MAVLYGDMKMMELISGQSFLAGDAWLKIQLMVDDRGECATSCKR